MRTHILTFLLGAAVAWCGASFYFSGKKEAGPGPVGSGKADRSVDARDSEETRGSDEEGLTGRLSANDKGSETPRRIELDASGNFVVPKELAGRLGLNLVRPDFTIDRDEARILRLSESESSGLEAMFEELRAESRDSEFAEFQILEQNDAGVTLEIPGDVSGAVLKKKRIDDRIASIFGNDRELVDLALRTGLEMITASYGAHTRVIRVEPDGESSFVFKVMYFDPETLDGLRSKEAPVTDYERASARTSIYWSKEAPKPLKHLFE